MKQTKLSTPYTSFANDYVNVGWPAPLPAYGKTLQVKGSSGRYPDPTRAKIQAWRKKYPRSDIALRMPDDCIALDIDAYNGDLEKLRKLESKYGKLPRTWNSDARGGKGGKLIFRVPADHKWKSEIKVKRADPAGIKVIQRTHRYIMVFPSGHDDAGRRYCWYYGLNGKRRLDWCPSPEECAELPEEWVSALVVGDAPEELRPGEVVAISDEELGTWLGQVPGYEDKPCKDVKDYVETMLKLFRECDTARSGLNDAAALKAIPGLFNAVANGHVGLKWALVQLRKIYVDCYQHGDRDRREQWTDMVRRWTEQRISNGLDLIPDVDPCEAEEDQDSDSWGFVDFKAVINGEPPPGPSILRRKDGKSLFYADKVHLVHAPSENLKSFYVQCACSEQVQKGNHIVYVDFEWDAYNMWARMTSLGLSEDQIRNMVHYIRPSEKLTDLPAFRDLVMSVDPAMVVLDGVNESMMLEELEDTKTADIAKWYRKFMRPLADLGVCVVAIDHEPHDLSAGRARPFGGQHKKAAVTGAMYGLRMSKPFGFGQTGRATITVTKDKPGQVDWKSKRDAGTLVLSSDAETGLIDWWIERPLDKVESEALAPRPISTAEIVREAVNEMEGDFTTGDVNEKTGIKIDTIRQCLHRMKNDGELRSVGHGKWRRA